MSSVLQKREPTDRTQSSGPARSAEAGSDRRPVECDLFSHSEALLARTVDSGTFTAQKIASCGQNEAWPTSIGRGRGKARIGVPGDEPLVRPMDGAKKQRHVWDVVVCKAVPFANLSGSSLSFLSILDRYPRRHVVSHLWVSDFAVGKDEEGPRSTCGQPIVPRCQCWCGFEGGGYPRASQKKNGARLAREGSVVVVRFNWGAATIGRGGLGHPVNRGLLDQGGRA